MSSRIPVLFTIPEAAERLRVNRFTAYRWVEQRQLESVRLGGKRLVTEDAICRFIERGRKLGACGSR